MERRVTGVGGKSIKENNFLQDLQSLRQSADVVQELCRKHVTKRASLTELTGQLTRRTPEMAEEGLPRLGVRSPARRTYDGVDRRPGRGRQKRKKSFKTTTLSWSEVGQMGIKYVEPEFGLIFPEIGHLTVVEPPRSRS